MSTIQQETIKNILRSLQGKITEVHAKELGDMILAEIQAAEKRGYETGIEVGQNNLLLNAKEELTKVAFLAGQKAMLE